MRKARRGQLEPLHCVCRPGKDAHPQHGRPGRHVAQHFDPRCPHWVPASSGLPMHRQSVELRTAKLRRVVLDE